MMVQIAKAESFLHRNPFHILGACTRDNQSRLVELAEERSLELDPDVCQQARADLVNPRSRLAAELSWLPGVSPRRAAQVMENIGDKASTSSTSELPPLAKANVLAARMEIFVLEPYSATDYLLEMAAATNEIDAASVLRDVNEDRSVAGVPSIKDVDVLEGELAARRRHYRDVSRDQLDRLLSSDLVRVTSKLIMMTTVNGEHPAGQFAEDVVAAYETGVQEFIRVESENVSKLIERIRAEVPANDGRLEKSITILCKILANWHQVVKPVQMICRANGVGHRASQEVAFAVRSLGIDLFNEHDLIDESAKITACLKREFAFLPEFSERITEDAASLDEIKARQERAQKQKEEFEESLTLSVDIGAVFKDRLWISVRGISYKQQFFGLESITRMRWGGTRHSVNGVPTGTTYEIHLGTAAASMSINLRNDTTYQDIIDRLWRGVGVRLAIEAVDRLKKGGQLNFPGAVIEDRAITLVRHHLFKANEQVRLDWSQVHIWNAAGCFCIGMKGDKKVYATLSYTTVDNVVVLENMIRAFFKNDKLNLSSLAD